VEDLFVAFHDEKQRQDLSNLPLFFLTFLRFAYRAFPGINPN
jgi:hypothetical protein